MKVHKKIGNAFVTKQVLSKLKISKLKIQIICFIFKITINDYLNRKNIRNNF